MTAFLLSNVTFACKRQPALRGLDLRLAAGVRTALLGANGAGKSTLLRLLDGRHFPQSGQITAFGAPLCEAILQGDTGQRGRRHRLSQQGGVCLSKPRCAALPPHGP